MEIVPFEIAKKLKEKGFREKCLLHYESTGGFYSNSIDTYDRPNQELDYSDFLKCFNEGNSIGLIDAPTISQVLKWLRKEKKIYLCPCVITDYEDDYQPHITFWSFIVINIESGDSIYREYEHKDEKRFDSYELAALAGIEYVIDNNLI